MASVSEPVSAAEDVRPPQHISDKDMLTSVIVYRLSVYFSLCLTVSTLYVPQMRTPEGVRRNRSFHMSLNTETRRLGASDHASKRPSMYSDFSKLMTRHASRHKNDRAFVDRMFLIFDINGDKVIERKEFKAVLQLLGIVNHNF